MSDQRMTRFELVIELGNDAMQEPVDVAAALRAAAQRVELGVLDGSLRDANGNTVGHWTFS